MAKKNPPPVPPLRHLADTPQKQGDIQDLHRFLFLLWNALGAGQDPFDDLLNTTRELLNSALAYIQNETPFVSSQSADYETSGNEFVMVTAESTMTLNPTPCDGERAAFLHDAGNGVQVSVTDGTGVDILFIPGTVLSYQYKQEFDKWVRGA